MKRARALQRPSALNGPGTLKRTATLLSFLGLTLLLLGLLGLALLLGFLLLRDLLTLAGRSLSVRRTSNDER